MATATASGHAARADALLTPVAEATLDGFSPEVGTLAEPPARWTALCDLSTEPARGERHAAIARAAGGGPAHLPLVWEVEGISWLVGALVGGPLVASGSLVQATAATTWVRFGQEGLAEAIAVDSRAPGAKARPVDRGVMAARARALVADLIEPVVTNGPRQRSRVLWWHAGDRIADAILWYGQALEKPVAARRVASALLAPGVPWSVPLAVDATGTSRPRRTCCLSRRTEAGETCEGCPHAKP